MRRGKKRKFGREKHLREALHKSLATALIEHGRIKTTSTKAKSLSSFADKLITIAKKQNLASRRLLAKNLHSRTVKKLVDELAPKFQERSGGYTRITRLGQRKSDGAEMAIIEFTA